MIGLGVTLETRLLYKLPLLAAFYMHLNLLSKEIKQNNRRLNNFLKCLGWPTRHKQPASSCNLAAVEVCEQLNMVVVVVVVVCEQLNLVIPGKDIFISWQGRVVLEMSEERVLAMCLASTNSKHWMWNTFQLELRSKTIIWVDHRCSVCFGWSVGLGYSAYGPGRAHDEHTHRVV